MLRFHLASYLLQNIRRLTAKGIGSLLLCSCVMSAQAPPRPRILGISHYAIFAHDYEKSRAFYGDFLGFQEPYDLKKPDGSPIMTFYKINDHQYIELYPEIEANSDRLSHISLETDDIEGLRQYLASKGVPVPPEAHTARIGNKSFDIIDPAGHKVEMVQYMRDGKTVANYGKYLGPNRISNHMTHVGLVVTKLDPEYKFYTEILGFKEIWRGSQTGNILSWVNLKVPDGDDYLEFMLNPKEPAPTERGSAHHICLVVPSVAASVETLKSRPYFKSYSHPIVEKTGVNRKRQANLYDPDGTRTELMEPATVDGKPTPPSTAPFPQ
jgi:lactoylglutathione lyase